MELLGRYIVRVRVKARVKAENGDGDTPERISPASNTGHCIRVRAINT